MVKAQGFCVMFCTVLGGLCVSLLYRADFIAFLVILLFALIALTMYFSLYKKSTFGCISKKLISVYSVISASVSVTVASSLITDSNLLSHGSYSLLILFTGMLAFCFAFSKKHALTSTVAATAIITIVIFIILLFLCILNADFTPVKIQSTNPCLFIPLAVFSVFDIFLALYSLDKPSKPIMIAGISAAALYMCALTVIAMSVLSYTVYNEFNMPLVMMLKSTYITSFLNSFEIVCISAFFVVCAVKAGIMLKPAVDLVNKKYWLCIAVALYALCTFLSMFSGMIFVFCVLAVLLAVLTPVLAHFGK